MCSQTMANHKGIILLSIVVIVVSLYSDTGHVSADKFNIEHAYAEARQCYNETHFYCIFSSEKCCRKVDQMCVEHQARCVTLPMLPPGTTSVQQLKDCCDHRRKGTPRKNNKKYECGFLFSSDILAEAVCRVFTAVQTQPPLSTRTTEKFEHHTSQVKATKGCPEADTSYLRTIAVGLVALAIATVIIAICCIILVVRKKRLARDEHGNQPEAPPDPKNTQVVVNKGVQQRGNGQIPQAPLNPPPALTKSAPKAQGENDERERAPDDDLNSKLIDLRKSKNDWPKELGARPKEHAARPKETGARPTHSLAHTKVRFSKEQGTDEEKEGMVTLSDGTKDDGHASDVFLGYDVYAPKSPSGTNNPGNHWARGAGAASVTLEDKDPNKTLNVKQRHGSTRSSGYDPE